MVKGIEILAFFGSSLFDPILPWNNIAEVNFTWEEAGRGYGQENRPILDNLRQSGQIDTRQIKEQAGWGLFQVGLFQVAQVSCISWTCLDFLTLVGVCNFAINTSRAPYFHLWNGSSWTEDIWQRIQGVDILRKYILTCFKLNRLVARAGQIVNCEFWILLRRMR